MILAPEGSKAEVAALAREMAGMEETLVCGPWEDLKAQLTDSMGQPDFWMQPDRHATLARLALMDRVRAAAATAEALRSRLTKGTERTGRHSRELVARLALQIHLLKEGIRDGLEAAPIEVALLVEPALEKSGEHQATRAWCQQVFDMYRAWGNSRHMQTAKIGPSSAAIASNPRRWCAT